MPEVDYVVLAEWFDWILKNIDVSVDLIGEGPLGRPSQGWEEVLGGLPASRGVGRALTAGDSFIFSPRADRIGCFWSLLVEHPVLCASRVCCDLMGFF